MEYNILNISFFIFLLFLAGSLAAQWIKFYPKSDSFLLNIFLSNMAFVLVLAMTYAIFKARFNTVFILLLLPLVLYFFTQKPKVLKPGFKVYLKGILGLLPMVLLTACFTYIYILPKSVEADVIYYSKIAGYLHDKGVENYYHYYHKA